MTDTTPETASLGWRLSASLSRIVQIVQDYVLLVDGGMVPEQVATLYGEAVGAIEEREALRLETKQTLREHGRWPQGVDASAARQAQVQTYAVQPEPVAVCSCIATPNGTVVSPYCLFHGNIRGE